MKVEWRGDKSMFKNQGKKIIIILLGILFCISIIMTAFYNHRQNVKKEKAVAEQKAIENAAIEADIRKKAISNAEKYGYAIGFSDEKIIYMEKDAVKYYFRVDVSGICFYYCKFAVEEENVTLKKGTVILTITDLGDGNVDVDYDDSRVLISDDGTEVPMYGGGYFVSNKDFDKESFVIDPVRIDGKQKSIEAYDTIMKFITVDDLKEHYNKALSICEQLNEGL